MSKNNREVAKRIADEAFDIRRELQYQAMLDWDKGIISGTEAIERIVGEEGVIHVQENFEHYRKQIALAKQNRKNKGKK